MSGSLTLPLVSVVYASCVCYQVSHLNLLLIFVMILPTTESQKKVCCPMAGLMAASLVALPVGIIIAREMHASHRSVSRQNQIHVTFAPSHPFAGPPLSLSVAVVYEEFTSQDRLHQAVAGWLRPPSPCYIAEAKLRQLARLAVQERYRRRIPARAWR